MSRGRVLFILVSLTTVFGLIGSSMLAAANRRQDDGKDSLYKYLAVFTEVLGLVERAYVDEPSEEELIAGAFEGTLDALDPFSLYVPAASVERYRAVRDLGSRPSGLLVLKERGVAYAVAVEDGSPADFAGLESGDILAAVDGERTRPMPLVQIRELLAGEVGSTVTVERIRGGQKADVAIELTPYDPPAVVLEPHDGVAVLRLPAFHDLTPGLVEASLAPLTGGAELPGLETMDRLVVDLRGVAGGDERAAYRVAALFASGELGMLSQRGTEVESFRGENPPIWQGRLAVLTDRATQGAAEVLVAVLQQAAGASQVGYQTFGHSGRRRTLELSGGGQLDITDAFFTGPDREPLAAALEPDEAMPPVLADEADDGDPVLERALEVLRAEPAEEELQVAA